MQSSSDTPRHQPISITSVVIPTFNRLELLQKTIASVVAQTSPYWQIIIADDGSTDGTIEYIQSLGDARIKCVALPRTGNVAKVRNAGVRASAGAYIAFLDSDDLWSPTKLEQQVAQMESTGAQWSYTAYDHVDIDGNVVPPKAGNPSHVLSGRILRALITDEVGVDISSLCVTRTLFDRVGGFHEEPWNLRGDVDLAIRLARAEPVTAVTDVLVHVREHPHRITNARTDAWERTAYVFRKVANETTDVELATLARARSAGYWAEAAAMSLLRLDVAHALRQFKAARSAGARPPQLLTTVLRKTAHALKRAARSRIQL